jgi:hypothetical protein
MDTSFLLGTLPDIQLSCANHVRSGHFRLVASTHAFTRVCKVLSCTPTSWEPCGPPVLHLHSTLQTWGRLHRLTTVLSSWYIYLCGHDQGAFFLHQATKILHFRRSRSGTHKPIRSKNTLRLQQRQQSWVAATHAPAPIASAHAEIAPANNVSTVVKSFGNILT